MKRKGNLIAEEIDKDYKRKLYFRCRKCAFFEDKKCKESRCVYDKCTKC